MNHRRKARNTDIKRTMPMAIRSSTHCRGTPVALTATVKMPAENVVLANAVVSLPAEARTLDAYSSVSVIIHQTPNTAVSAACANRAIAVVIRNALYSLSRKG